MRKDERDEHNDHKAAKCPYCGSLVDLFLIDILSYETDITKRQEVVDYINSLLMLPTRSVLNKSGFEKHDRRCFEKNNPLSVKKSRMFKHPIIDNQPDLCRVRYTPKTKYKTKDYLQEAILSCECTKTLGIHPDYTLESYSHRIGYNNKLAEARQYVINFNNRRP